MLGIILVIPILSGDSPLLISGSGRSLFLNDVTLSLFPPFACVISSRRATGNHIGGLYPFIVSVPSATPFLVSRASPITVETAYCASSSETSVSPLCAIAG